MLSQRLHRSSFAGRWCAKEAVIKAISNYAPDLPHLWHGGGGSLKQIEVTPSPSRAPRVTLLGAVKAQAEKVGVTECKLSISHSGAYAMAVAVANGPVANGPLTNGGLFSH